MKSETRFVVFRCAHCDKEFKYESEKRRHEQSHEPQFECKACFKKFSFVSALRRHEKQHERIGSVECSKCARKFKDEILLKRHMQYAHKGIYTCKKCSAILNSDIALRTHVLTHKSELERKYRCSQDGCTKTFNFAHHLKHHELTHTDDKPHVCIECGKRFIQLHHLKIHLRVHNPDSWLTCTDCNKEYTNEYALRRHIATHKAKPRKFRCENQKKADQPVITSITTQVTLSQVLTKISEKGNIDCKFEKDFETLQLNQSQEETCIPHESKLDTLLKNSNQVLNLICDNSTINSAVDKEHSESLNIGQEFEINDMATSVKFEEFEEIATTDENVELDDIDMSSAGSKSQIDKPVIIVNPSPNGNSVAIIDENERIDNLEEASISNCKSVIGKCIVTGDTETNESCLCAQMSIDETADIPNNSITFGNLETVDVFQNPTDIPNNSITFGNLKLVDGFQNSVLLDRNNTTLKIIDDLKCMEKRRKNANACESCECASICAIKDKPLDSSISFDAPELERRNDDIIKIKNTFDIDTQDESVNKFEFKTSVQVNSCKDILGNCIVSGDGMIGEGCLCARMAADDQVITQEIEEITPCPKNVDKV